MRETKKKTLDVKKKLHSKVKREICLTCYKKEQVALLTYGKDVDNSLMLVVVILVVASSGHSRHSVSFSCHF